MTAQQLFEQHAAKQLLQFVGSLRGFVEDLDVGAIPDNRHIRIYVPILKEHLRSAGTPEDDDILLRYGLIIPGRFRGVEPPLAAILGDRGGLSEQRIGEAAGQITQLRAALDFGRGVFPNLSSETTIALRELLRVVQSATVPDDKWVESHANLAQVEFHKLLNLAFGRLDGSDLERDLATKVFQSLAQFRKEGLGRFADMLVLKDVLWPPIMYRDASPATAAALVERIHGASDTPSVRGFLFSLAWTRGETAHRTFAVWKSAPPAWSALVGEPILRCAHMAGWSLDKKGEVRNLFSLKSHRISAIRDQLSPGYSIDCRIPANGRCPNCEDTLSYLFDFVNVPDFFFTAELAHAPRRVLSCLNCVAYRGPFFSLYGRDAGVTRHPATLTLTKRVDGSGADGRPPVRRWLEQTPFPPFATVFPFSLADTSTLGGAPAFVQHEEYPDCPECQQTMVFLAQLDNGSLPWPEEGTFYSFFCANCRISAVTYQQT